MVSVFAATAFIPTGPRSSSPAAPRRGAEGARGDLRRPGGAVAGRAGPRDLLERVAALFDEEAARYRARCTAPASTSDFARRLRAPCTR
jgi:hypothetical protein